MVGTLRMPASGKSACTSFKRGAVPIPSRGTMSTKVIGRFARERRNFWDIVINCALHGRKANTKAASRAQRPLPSAPVRRRRAGPVEIGERACGPAGDWAGRGKRRRGEALESASRGPASNSSAAPLPIRDPPDSHRDDPVSSAQAPGAQIAARADACWRSALACHAKSRHHGH